MENSVAKDATLSSPEVCTRAGCTYRQLDYWVRHGAITPTVAANGSGSQRRFTETDLVAVRVATRLSLLGAPAEVRVAAARAVAALDAHDWLVVTRQGDILSADQFAALLLSDEGSATAMLVDGAWIIDLREALDEAALVG